MIYCTIRIAKTNALISCAVTAQLICVFVFAYAKSRFSHNKALMFLVQFVDMTYSVLVTLNNRR